MDFRDYVRTIQRRWLMIAICFVVGLAVAAGLVVFMAPTYQASARLFVSTQAVGTAAEAFQGSSYTQQRIQSYVEVISDPIVLDPVIEELGLDVSVDELGRRVSAVVIPDTVLLEITVTDASPQAAADIANAAARTIRDVVVDQLEERVGDEPALVSLSIVRRATLPDSPSSPNIPLFVGLGAIGGLGLGLALAFLRQAIDSRIHGEREVRTVTAAPLLGGIAFDGGASKNPLIVHSDPSSARAEAFRSLRTNLQYVDFEAEHRSFVVTSSVESEGKTTTAANTAIALADMGRPTLLIDADLRRPRIADYMGIEGGVGLSNVLVGEASLVDAVQPWGTTGRLWVLPSGRVPPNPSELLGSETMEKLLSEIRGDFKYVVIDAPPLLPVTDGAVLSKMTGGAVLVVRAGSTGTQQLRQAIESLENIDATLLGLVLNMLPGRGPDSYGVYGGYYYRAESSVK